MCSTSLTIKLSLWDVFKVSSEWKLCFLLKKEDGCPCLLPFYTLCWLCLMLEFGWIYDHPGIILLKFPLIDLFIYYKTGGKVWCLFGQLVSKGLWKISCNCEQVLPSSVKITMGNGETTKLWIPFFCFPWSQWNIRQQRSEDQPSVKSLQFFLYYSLMATFGFLQRPLLRVNAYGKQMKLELWHL